MHLVAFLLGCTASQPNSETDTMGECDLVPDGSLDLAPLLTQSGELAPDQDTILCSGDADFRQLELAPGSGVRIDVDSQAPILITFPDNTGEFVDIEVDEDGFSVLNHDLIAFRRIVTIQIEAPDLMQDERATYTLELVESLQLGCDEPDIAEPNDTEEMAFDGVPSETLWSEQEVDRFRVDLPPNHALLVNTASYPYPLDARIDGEPFDGNTPRLATNTTGAPIEVALRAQAPECTLYRWYAEVLECNASLLPAHRRAASWTDIVLTGRPHIYRMLDELASVTPTSGSIEVDLLDAFGNPTPVGSADAGDEVLFAMGSAEEFLVRSTGQEMCGSAEIVLNSAGPE